MQVDYKLLLSGLERACTEMNIQAVKPFVDKVGVGVWQCS